MKDLAAWRITGLHGIFFSQHPTFSYSMSHTMYELAFRDTKTSLFVS